LETDSERGGDTMKPASQTIAFLFVVSLAVSLAACGGAEGGAPTAQPSPAVTAEQPTPHAESPTAQLGSATPAALSYCLPQFDDNGVAGGEVESGPFTFHLALYTDSAIKSPQEADHPSRASDIPGVGWQAKWTYHGLTTELGAQAYGLLSSVVSDIEGGIEGPVPPERPELVTGGSGGRDGGGVVLPSGATDGDLIGLGIRVRILEGSYGAALFFTLRERDGEIAACDVTVTQWPE
jgi:hypothetical protein